jgi:hypothetical protein
MVFFGFFGGEMDRYGEYEGVVKRGKISICGLNGGMGRS